MPASWVKLSVMCVQGQQRRRYLNYVMKMKWITGDAGKRPWGACALCCLWNTHMHTHLAAVLLQCFLPPSPLSPSLQVIVGKVSDLNSSSRECIPPPPHAACSYPHGKPPHWQRAFSWYLLLSWPHLLLWFHLTKENATNSRQALFHHVWNKLKVAVFRAMTFSPVLSGEVDFLISHSNKDFMNVSVNWELCVVPFFKDHDNFFVIGKMNFPVQ